LAQQANVAILRREMLNVSVFYQLLFPRNQDRE